MNAETEEKSQTLRLNVIELCNLLSKSFMILSEYFLEFEGESLPHFSLGSDRCDVCDSCIDD